MKREYVLPAAFAATILAFTFSALPNARSRTLAPGEAPAQPPGRSKEKLPEEKLALLEPEPAPDEGGDPGDAKPAGAGAPRISEWPPISDPPGPFIMRPLPPSQGDGSGNVIPITWSIPRPTPISGSGPVAANLLDQPPRARVQLAPEYPPDLRYRHMEGEVLVEFVVDESGNVHQPVALRATDPKFEEAALRAVARWRFEPGYYHNRKVRFRMSVPIVFSLSSE